MPTTRRTYVALTVFACAVVLTGASTAAARTPTPLSCTPPLRVMALGDSVTKGTGDATAEGYRSELKRSFGYQSCPIVYVGSQPSTITSDPTLVHEGHTGWRIDQIRASIDAWQATYTPDLIFLNIGTNDSFQVYDPPNMGARWQDLVQRILANDPDVVVLTAEIIPSWSPYPDRIISDQASVYSQRFNRELHTRALSMGPRVGIANMSLIGQDYPVTWDGAHPSHLGYLQMAWIWWRCLAPWLSPDGVTRYMRVPLSVAFPDSMLCQTP